jgi:hypothetical protein
VVRVAGNAPQFDGFGTSARFDTPSGVCFADNGRIAFVMEEKTNSVIRKIEMATAEVSSIAGGGQQDNSLVYQWDGIGYGARLWSPVGCAANAEASILYFVESGAANQGKKLRQIDLSTRNVTTICGGGSGGGTDEGNAGVLASFDDPSGVALSADATEAYVVDAGVHRVRQVILAIGVVTTLAGSTQGFADGVGASAMFYQPRGITYGPGGILYVTDGRNYRIRQITIATGAVTTLTGVGTSGNDDGLPSVATFRNPFGITVTADGTRILVSDTTSHLIRQVLTGSTAAVQSPPPPAAPPPPPLRFLRQNTRPGNRVSNVFEWNSRFGLLKGGASQPPSCIPMCCS